MLIQTTKGLIDRSELEIKDIFFEEDNARVLATEWYLQGEMVRRDVLVNVLKVLELENQQQQI